MPIDYGFGPGVKPPKKKPNKPKPAPNFTTPSESRGGYSSSSGYSNSGSSSSSNISTPYSPPSYSSGSSGSSSYTSDDVSPSFVDPIQSRTLAMPTIEPVDSRVADLEDTKVEGIKSLLEELSAKPAASAAVGKRVVTVKQRSPYFSDEQLDNARAIARVGTNMDMSKRDIMIGLMTAMQESTLRNLDWGDRDSLGLFQQRPSMGWGSPEQVTDPQYAARKFFEGLKGVTDRGNMAPTYAAQAVQRSAYPDAYAKWEDEARSIMTMTGKKPKPFLRGLNNLITPIKGASLQDMTSDFGPRTHPVTGRYSYHTGADLGMPMGTPILAPSNAVVEELNRGDSIYGNQAILGHGRDIQTMYGHMEGFADLEVGEKIRKGDVLGYVGSTGLSTGPHLHWETWLEGKPVNPVGFLQGDYAKVKPQRTGAAGYSRTSPVSSGSSSGSGSYSGASMVSGSSGSSGSSLVSGFSGLSGGTDVPPFIASLMAPDGRDFRGLDMSAITEMLMQKRTPKTAESQDDVLAFLLKLLSESAAA